MFEKLAFDYLLLDVVVLCLGFIAVLFVAGMILHVISLLRLLLQWHFYLLDGLPCSGDNSQMAILRDHAAFALELI